MEKQYIGARYVPLIMGQWDKNNEYEPLSIVQNNGASYTSRKKVPADIDILNTEYWVKTSDTSVEVENLTNKVNKTSKLTLLQNKKINVFGDSISSEPNYWPNFLQNYVDCTVNNFSVAGASLIDIANTISSTAADSGYDVVNIIFGGTNDYNLQNPLGNVNDNTANTVFGALNNIATNLKNKFPNAVNYFLSPLKRSQGTSAAVTYPLEIICQIIESVANKNNCGFISMYNAPNYTGVAPNAWDGLHPSENYQVNILAPYIARRLSAMENDIYNYAAEITTTIQTKCKSILGNVQLTLNRTNLEADSGMQVIDTLPELFRPGEVTNINCIAGTGTGFSPVAAWLDPSGTLNVNIPSGFNGNLFAHCEFVRNW